MCQANIAVLPRLKDNGTKITFAASNQIVKSLGPEANLAETFVFDGAFGEKSVTLGAKAENQVTQIFAAAHVASGNPPNPDIQYQIEYRIAGSERWTSLVKDWSVPRLGGDPGDFWSQSFCYGSDHYHTYFRNEHGPLWNSDQQLQIRFHNNGGKRYLRAEAHLIQQLPKRDPVAVTYNWSDDEGTHEASMMFAEDGEWALPTGSNVETNWVQISAPNKGG